MAHVDIGSGCPTLSPRDGEHDQNQNGGPMGFSGPDFDPRYAAPGYSHPHYRPCICIDIPRSCKLNATLLGFLAICHIFVAGRFQPLKAMGQLGSSPDQKMKHR